MECKAECKSVCTLGYYISAAFSALETHPRSPTVNPLRTPHSKADLYHPATNIIFSILNPVLKGMASCSCQPLQTPNYPHAYKAPHPALKKTVTLPLSLPSTAHQPLYDRNGSESHASHPVRVMKQGTPEMFSFTKFPK